MLLEINHLFFGYETKDHLFKNLNLRMKQGEIVALAGESGCGKSTLLNLIYGLLDWENGEIIFDGTKLLGPKGNIVPGESDMKMVAQTYNLMPYSTVYDNVGKFISNINLKEKREKVLELLEVVGLENYADEKPKNLSGGQQQRVAIARALSVLPKLLLLDEPFSNIDFSRKIELRERLFRYAREKNISLLISTHEIQEVMPWLDRIIVLQEGRLIQNDSPLETYKTPYNDYVARLFGEVNILTKTEAEKLSTTDLHWYPHEIKISNSGLKAEVIESRFGGSYFWNKIRCNEVTLICYSDAHLTGEILIELKQK